MRVPATTARHYFPTSISVCIRHTTFRATPLALNFDVGSRSRHAIFDKLQRSRTVDISFVNKIQPWEVIQMTKVTGNKKARWYDGRRFSCVAETVNKTVLIRPIRIRFKREHSRLQRSKDAASGTYNPIRERGNWNTHLRTWIKRILKWAIAWRWYWRFIQSGYFRTSRLFSNSG